MYEIQFTAYLSNFLEDYTIKKVHFFSTSIKVEFSQYFHISWLKVINSQSGQNTRDFNASSHSHGWATFSDNSLEGKC